MKAGRQTRPRWAAVCDGATRLRQVSHFAETRSRSPVDHPLARRPKGRRRLLTVMADASERAHTTLAIVEQALEGREYLADPGFTVADIMIGFTLIAARVLGVSTGATRT